MSLDRYIADPAGGLDWMTGTPDLLEYATETMRTIDTMLMGRRTYLEQAAAWPHRQGDLADAVNAHDKVVFTSRPDEIDLGAWDGSRAAIDPAVEIGRLQQTAGGLIGVSGGAAFLRSLFESRLIDEVRVITHPVTLGSGLSPWAAGLRLRPTDVRDFDSGAQLRTYTLSYPTAS